MSRKLRFQPEAWHACQDKTWKNCDSGVNCYSYALDEAGYYWSIPGSGYQKTEPLILSDKFDLHYAEYSLAEFCDAIIEGAVQDGLVPTENTKDHEGHYLTALFLSDRLDRRNFHWYRKDDGGSWSHKDCWSAPTNLTPQGSLIRDPLADPPADYPIFGGFFLAPRAGVILTEGYRLAG